MKVAPMSVSTKKIFMDIQLHLAPQTTRVISIKPKGDFFRKRISFIIGTEIQRKGNYTYNVRCFQKEKELPILLNNPQNNKVVIPKGPIGHTPEDIQIEPKKKFTVVDNLAFIDHLMTSDTDWNQVFHVNENYISPIIDHKPDTSHLDQRKKIEKKH